MDHIKAMQSLAPESRISGSGKGMGGTAPIDYSLTGDAGSIDVAAGVSNRRCLRIVMRPTYAPAMRAWGRDSTSLSIRPKRCFSTFRLTMRHGPRESLPAER